MLALAPEAIMLSEFRGTPPSQAIAQQLKDAGFNHQRTTACKDQPTRNGLLIAAQTPVRRLHMRSAPTEPARWLAVRLRAPRITLAGMHIPTQHTGRKAHYHDAVINTMARWRGGPAIFAGDTNSGRQRIDEETRVFNRRTHEWFDAIERCGWRDAYRLIHPADHSDLNTYTWFSPTHDNGFRLDQAFLSPHFIPPSRVDWDKPKPPMSGITASGDVKIEHCWPRDPKAPKRRDSLSDHAAVLLEVPLPAALPG